MNGTVCLINLHNEKPIQTFQRNSVIFFVKTKMSQHRHSDQDVAMETPCHSTEFFL